MTSCRTFFALVCLSALSLASCEPRGSAVEDAGAPKAGPASAPIVPKAQLVPELPPEKLPPRTSVPPDPAVDRYLRGKVFIHIDEEVKPKERPAYSPPTRVLENYLAEYFRRAGFEVAARPEDGERRIEGKFRAEFVEAIVFEGKPLVHKYKGTVDMSVRGKGGEELEKVDEPGFFKDGILKPEYPEDHYAVLEMRRHLAKIIWERLFHAGKTFTDPEIPSLVATLAADDSEKEAPVQADDVLKALVKRRFDAVPYLLDFLTDEREVRVNAHYPGLTPQNAGKLRIYHIADKALEEIFQKVSRMDLETPSKARFAIIQGWENEWRRFCPTFRDSPQRSIREARARPTP